MRVVLLPGLDGTGELLEPFVEAIGAHAPVTVVRYPPKEFLTYRELDTRVRQGLPDDEPYVLLGEFFSGPVAILLAASCPMHLKGLVLCCTFARSPRRLLGGLSRIADRLPIERVPPAIMSLLLMNSLSHHALRSRLDRALRQIAPAVVRGRIGSVLGVDVVDQCGAIRVPVLYLRAARDRLVPASASRLIARVVPNSREAVLDAPHFLLQTVPYQAAQIVRQFLWEAAGSEIV